MTDHKSSKQAESLANAVAMAAIGWEAVERSWDQKRGDGGDFIALRLWLALVYVALETWNDVAVKLPSEKLAAFSSTPEAGRLRLLRNKTFHHGGSLLPKQVAAFWDEEDSIKWAHDVFTTLSELAAVHFLGWKPADFKRP